jgi:hypothetical protein
VKERSLVSRERVDIPAAGEIEAYLALMVAHSRIADLPAVKSSVAIHPEERL